MTIDCAERFFEIIVHDFNLRIALAEMALKEGNLRGRGVLVIGFSEQSPLHSFYTTKDLLASLNISFSPLSTIPPVPQNMNVLQACRSYNHNSQFVVALYRHTRQTIGKYFEHCPNDVDKQKLNEMIIKTINVL